MSSVKEYLEDHEVDAIDVVEALDLDIDVSDFERSNSRQQMNSDSHPQVIAQLKDGKANIASSPDDVTVRTNHESVIVDGENAHRYSITVAGDGVDFSSVTGDSGDDSDDDGLTVSMEHRSWSKGGD